MKSNQVFLGIIKKLRREGLDTTKHKPPISERDMTKMYESGTLSNDHPWGLLQKIYFEISLHFCRRGCEGLRELKKSSFIFKTNDNGVEYATMAYHETEKRKQGHEKDQHEKVTRMYSQPGPNCPVNSLKLLLKKLNKECQSLFQYPTVNWHNNDVWFNNQPLGKNAISKLMTKISQSAQLSCIYTNHSIRATSITALSRAGVQSTSIQHVSGHKSVDSLKHYAQMPSENQCQQMSTILHKVSHGTPTDNLVVNPPCQSIASVPQPTTPSIQLPQSSFPPFQPMVGLSQSNMQQIQFPASFPIFLQGATINGNVTFNISK